MNQKQNMFGKLCYIVCFVCFGGCMVSASAFTVTAIMTSIEHAACCPTIEQGSHQVSHEFRTPANVAQVKKPSKDRQIDSPSKPFCPPFPSAEAWQWSHSCGPSCAHLGIRWSRCGRSCPWLRHRLFFHLFALEMRFWGFQFANAKQTPIIW